jgi:cytoskeletal protein RodZ
MDTTLASQLRHAREERGLSLADAAHATRIPVPRLQQLEDNNLAAFGSMAYARGFIRNYSEFLGIDASKFVKSLPEPIFGGPHDYRYLTDSYGPWIDHRVRSSSYGQRDPSSASARGVYALVLFLVLGICSAVLAHNFLFPQGNALETRPTAAVHAQNPVSDARPISTASKAPQMQEPTRVPFTPIPSPPKLVSLATPPALEIRTPDVSSLRVKRAEPVEEDNQTHGNAQ